MSHLIFFLILAFSTHFRPINTVSGNTVWPEDPDFQCWMILFLGFSNTVFRPHRVLFQMKQNWKDRFFFDVYAVVVKIACNSIFPQKKANNEDWIWEMIMSYKIPWFYFWVGFKVGLPIWAAKNAHDENHRALLRWLSFGGASKMAGRVMLLTIFYTFLQLTAIYFMLTSISCIQGAIITKIYRHLISHANSISWSQNCFR